MPSVWPVASPRTGGLLSLRGGTGPLFPVPTFAESLRVWGIFCAPGPIGPPTGDRATGRVYCRQSKSTTSLLAPCDRGLRAVSVWPAQVPPAPQAHRA